MNPETTSATTPAPDTTQQRFSALLRTAQKVGRWQRLLLAKPHNAEPGLQRVVVRPLLLRGQAVLSFVYSYSTRDITKNLPVDEGLALVDHLLAGPFRNAHLLTPNEETQLTLSKKGKAHLGVHARQASGDESSRQPTSAGQYAAPHAAQTATPAEAHDRAKQRFINIERPFLVALGVTTAQHQLVPAMARKWKQINKFVEIFDHALQTSPLASPQPDAQAPARPLRVVDFGAGKAYLSFAVHDWLQQGRQLQADVVGVELRPDLVQQGNRIVSELGLQGMRLRAGDVREWQHGQQGPAEPMDVMMALHACDTATDHALHLGIRAGASILLCSPCCHKQLRPQLLSPHPLRSVFQHGIHAEQQAEMITDTLRALLLQAHGYDTQVFEFVALEHTRKNKMILAVKRPQPPAAQARQDVLMQVEELKRFFGVREHCLQTLLQNESAVLA